VRGGRAGAALLEAVIALLILGTACVSAVAMAATFSRTVAHARELDRSVRRASALLDAVSLWTRTDLDRRLGDREQGPWTMRIDRPAPTLYTVVLSDSAGTELLRTSLFRADTTRAAP
jgi:type II secretory pathway pseudopilin PulG